ncbi:MAG: hypothetical protein LZF86_10214 [Nitrospira sp.]|nr:MAG: hypothetical protein LZF86_10214 [Nitrospira sp.]
MNVHFESDEYIYYYRMIRDSLDRRNRTETVN